MRKYITGYEWELFYNAIDGGINTVRDRMMFHLAYRHGLRVSEMTSLRVNDLDLHGKSLYVRRLKNGLSTVHPLQDDTCELLLKWLRVRDEYPQNKGNEQVWLFLSRSGSKLSRQRVFRLARRYGSLAGLPFSLHPHMFRHACGYALADQGLDTRLIQDYLGHRNIQHTVRYTASNVHRFRRVWRGKGIP